MCPQQFFGKRKHYCKVIFLLLPADRWPMWSWSAAGCCGAGPWGTQPSLSGGGTGDRQKVGAFVANSGEGRAHHCPHEHLPVPARGSCVHTHTHTPQDSGCSGFLAYNRLGRFSFFSLGEGPEVGEAEVALTSKHSFLTSY